MRAGSAPAHHTAPTARHIRAVALTGAVVLGVGLAAPASAHHGTSQYDFERETVLRGRVAAYTFGAPHIWLTLQGAPGSGRSVEWSLEGPPPQYAGRRGWAADSLKPGQTVSVAMAPRRDGRNAGLILTVSDAGGRVLLERGRRY